MQDALGVIEGGAVYGGPELPVAVRIADNDEAIFLDLADSQWRAVDITAHGWTVVVDPPMKFLRPRGVLALPEPVRGGSVADLRRFVNAGNEESWRLMVSWLLATFRPRGPYPILVLHGEQGSAKSTTARILRALIDPNAGPLRAEPREARDLMIAASNGWVVALDNLSWLPPWLSDALCRLSTGGGFATRQLYTDDEEMIFDAQRPVILNGIEEIATRSDLLDRSLVLQLPALSEDRCRPEAELWADFAKARPRILGALLDAVAAAMKVMPTVRLTRLPRMADFAVWATAAETALGWEPGAFMAAYTGNRGEANDLALDSSPIAGLLRDLADDGPWEGTCADLLTRLTQAADVKLTGQKVWPKDAAALGRQLARLKPNLRRAGITVETWRETSRQRRRMVRIARIANKNSDATDCPNCPDRPNTEQSSESARTVADGNSDSSDGQPIEDYRDRTGADGSDGDLHTRSKSRRRTIEL
jgi:hypothetical protein